MNRESFEQLVSTVSSRVTYTGAGGTLMGWFLSNEFLGLAGLVLGTAGLLVNWYYKHKQDKRNELSHKRWMDKMTTTGPAPLSEN